MTFRIVFTTKAQLEFNQSALWWAENRSIEQAAGWLEGFEQAIQSLAENPARCSLANEDPCFSFELRQLLYGLGNKPTHRAIFYIREDRVIIYGIRHLAQRDVTPEDS